MRGSARRRTALTSSSLSVFSHDAPQDHSNHRIRRVDIATGATTTLAGSGTQGFLDGAGGSARFNMPSGVAIDPSGTFALVAVRWPPLYPRIPPSNRRHTRLAHGVGAAPASTTHCAARPPV